MMYAPDGRARVSIFSIAHLNDSERMFFVSLLLNQMLGWMRSQSGTTSSLRAMLYMDEIYGYLPPSANATVEEAYDDHAEAGAAPSDSAFFLQPRTLSILTTRRSPTSGHGFSVDSRRSETKHAFSTDLEGAAASQRLVGLIETAMEEIARRAGQPRLSHEQRSRGWLPSFFTSRWVMSPT